MMFFRLKIFSNLNIPTNLIIMGIIVSTVWEVLTFQLTVGFITLLLERDGREMKMVSMCKLYMMIVFLIPIFDTNNIVD